MTDPTTTAEVKRRASFTPNDEIMDAQLRRIAKAVLDDNCLGLMWGAVADKIIAAHASARDVIDQQANRLNELSERLTAEQPSQCETESHTIKLMGATAVIRDLRAELDAANRNLAATQAECTRLLERNRELEAARTRLSEDAEYTVRWADGSTSQAVSASALHAAQEALASESAKVGEQATEIDRMRERIRTLEAALSGEPKVGKRRKQVMRALGLNTSHASEHSPTWDELCVSVARLATNVSDSATWLDEHCPEGWGCALSVIGSNGWYAYGGGSRTPYCKTPRLAREALARMRGGSGPTAQTAPSGDAVATQARQDTPPVHPDPGKGSGGPSPTSCDTVTVNSCLGCGKTANETELVHGPVGVSLCCDCIDALAYAAKAARAGYDPMVGPPPDPCPLPADARQWRRNDSHDIVFQVAPSEYWRVTVVGPRGQHEYWVRHERPGKSNYPDSIVAKAECKTVRGGLRLGVKEARRIWRVKNGSKP
jgi:uncharacterized coiled-coil protein SlyX